MPGKGFTITLIITAALLINSCSAFLKAPEVLCIHSIRKNDQSAEMDIKSSEYLFYDSKGELLHDKTVTMDGDSISSVSVNINYSISSKNYFSASWEPIEQRANFLPANVLRRQSERRPKAPGKDETISFSYLFTDTINRTTYKFEYESIGDYINVNEAIVSHKNDSVSYERILELSPEIIGSFRQTIFRYRDSIAFVSFPELPDLTACKLIVSRFTFIENSSDLTGNKKETTIDSSFIDGTPNVKHNEDFYFFYDEYDADRGYKFKRYTANYYLEQHYSPNEQSPYYELNYRIASNGTDTIFKSEMTTIQGRRFDCVKFVQSGQLSQRSFGNDLSIVKRQMCFWFNKRTHAIVRKHYAAFTNENHYLERDWFTSNYKIIKLTDTIPGVSGIQLYDIVPDNFNEPHYPFSNSSHPRKHKQSHKSADYYTKKAIKRIRERTVELEKDRKSGYEKRISSDSTEMYEIFYRPRKQKIP